MNNTIFFDGTSREAALAANAEHDFYDEIERYDAAVDNAIDAYDALNPNATEAERENAISRIIDRIDRKFLNGEI